MQRQVQLSSARAARAGRAFVARMSVAGRSVRRMLEQRALSATS